MGEFDEISYSKASKNTTKLAEMLNYSIVLDNGSDVYPIDMANAVVKNVRITTADADEKEITVANAPAEAELFIELTCANGTAIKWFTGITWLSGSAPVFTVGKVYRIALFKYGAVWHGNCVGGW